MPALAHITSYHNGAMFHDRASLGECIRWPGGWKKGMESEEWSIVSWRKGIKVIRKGLSLAVCDHFGFELIRSLGKQNFLKYLKFYFVSENC